MTTGYIRKGEEERRTGISTGILTTLILRGTDAKDEWLDLHVYVGLKDMIL